MAKKYGCQTPTKSYVLPYKKSKYLQAIKLYEKTGKKPIKWQKDLLKDMMALDEDGLWTHQTVGYSLPRRNGKTEDVYMREIWGLMNGEQIAHTAHRIPTAHSSFKALCVLLNKMEVQFSSIKAKGQEEIRIPETNGYITYRTRSGQGGLGEGFDLLVIDEAQEYNEEQQSALSYTVSDSPNPQTIMCGTPPTAQSRGTVFPKYRKNVLAGKKSYSMWYEWSVDKMSDCYDKSLWYLTNPSLGYHLTERKTEQEINGDDLDFNIQRLGLWIEYNLASAITEKDWQACLVDVLPTMKSKLFVGIKFAKGSQNVALSIAVKTADGKIFVECLDCRDSHKGNDWILAFLKSADVKKVVIDGASGQNTLATDMKDARIKVKPILPRVADVIDANSQFENGIFKKEVVHKEQPSLSWIITNCEHRAIGTSGGFGFTPLGDAVDICLMDSVALAYWACRNTKEVKKQRISY